MSSPSTPRRVFLVRAATGGAVLVLAATCGGAHAATHVDENDEVARQLGYRHDARQVDAATFPRYHAGERCADCSFFQGAPTDEWAGCAMFGRKQIHAAGWCNAWARQPG